MTNQQRISGVDTAWLRMEQPTNLMMIVGVMMLEGRVRAADLERVLEARFLGGFPRFRQRARVDATGAWWETPTRFRLRDHVHRVRLPDAAGKEELEALVSELASTPLDAGRPLWDFHLVENYAGGSALVARIHHCYADGIALVQVMLSLTHATAAGSLRIAGKASTPHPPDEEDFWSQLLAPLTAALGNAPQAARSLLAQGRGLAERPEAAAEAVQELARKCGAFAAEVARLLLMGPDAATRFKGPLGTRKRAAWAEPLPLDQVKIVGRALGCSINDVLVSMAAGALRDYLEEKGDPVDGLEIRAVVPVNLRPQGTGRGLGNQFGLVFLELPIGIAHPLERVYEVRRRMLALKGSYQPLIALGLLSAIGYGPRALQDPVTALLGGSASAVITNVPGPQHPLFLAGRHITELDFWVPQSGGIGVGVSILSYDGRIQFGIVTDAGLVPDPGRIVGRFGEEFARLLWITLMSPWAEGDAAPPAAARKRLRKR